MHNEEQHNISSFGTYIFLNLNISKPKLEIFRMSSQWEFIMTLVKNLHKKYWSCIQTSNLNFTVFTR